MSSICFFVNSQWLFTLEENCLEKIHFDKIHFDMNGRVGIKYEGILGNVCAQCQIKLRLKIIHREFDYLDKSYILTKK